MSRALRGATAYRSGALAEEAVARHYEERGALIAHRRWRGPFGEIDLIAREGARVVIVEVKVSRADLMGDGKWPDYLGHCDRFFWALPAGFDTRPLDAPAFLPARTGIIVADRYDAEIVREAQTDLAYPDFRNLAEQRRRLIADLLDRATALFKEVALAEDYAEFLTLPAYERMP